MQALSPASFFQSVVYSSSAGNTATPSAGNAEITAPFSWATASTLAMNSWCSRCALITTPTVGCAISASKAISPGWFIPNSMTAPRWNLRKRKTVCGTPIALFRLPCVAKAPSPNAQRKMLASIWVTVVFPLLPVTAITGICIWLLQPLANWPNPVRVSGTSIQDKWESAFPVATMAALTPLWLTCSRKSWASKRSP